MTPRVTAVRLHEPAQVKETLEQALQIVGELEVDGDLRETAFRAAVDLLAARIPVMEQGPPLAVQLPNLAGRLQG